MALAITANTRIRKDAENHVRNINHVQQPYELPGVATVTPLSLASAYLKDAASIYEIPDASLKNINEKIPGEYSKGNGMKLQFEEQKTIKNTHIVSFIQAYDGLPIWHAGVRVNMDSRPIRVTSSINTLHYQVEVDPLNNNDVIRPGDNKAINELLDAVLKKAKGRLLRINRVQLWVYQYDARLRFGHDDEDEHKVIQKLFDFPAVPKNIQPGKHYICTEVLFSAKVAKWKELHFRALLENKSGAVVYFRAGLNDVTGLIFPNTPDAQANDSALTACSAAADLDIWRTSVELQGLNMPAPGDDQELDGEYVTLGEKATPTIAPPTEPVGTNFDYTSTSDDFAAVNAYANVDNTFRFIESLGFNLSTYFNGTTFPVTVDHRDASLGTVNARAYSNAGFNGSGGFGFNLCSSGCPVGIAGDIIIVWHEMCHALLLDNVGGFNFGFAHSAGDTLGVIVSDWNTRPPDRFDTFPFNDIDRRHDRDVASGWAWGGVRDTGSYQSESILATTLFRFYRSIGGDSTHQNVRRLAAYHSAYLIIGAIGTLTAATNPSDPEDFATSLMDFDLANDYDGISRGALHKVLRWAFEQQGAYQPVGAPTPVVTVGDPPDVDVYINDGRDGAYGFLGNFWNCQDMWNRNAIDGGTGHQTPILDVPNYMYVRVKNRGTATATNVNVKAFHCRPSTGLVWPDDWQAMTTAELPGGDIAPGAEIIVGPFEWTPVVEGHECLLAIAAANGDPGNDTTVTGSIPHGRFVPFDNNIGQRNVAPVPGGGGAQALFDSFRRRRFWLNNPYQRTIEASIEIQLPAFLQNLGWELEFLNPGGIRFTLGPRDNREIVFRMKKGADFTPAQVGGSADRMITVSTFADGVLTGGMSYLLDPALTHPPVEKPAKPDAKHCSDATAELLECFGLPSGKVACTRIKSITFETKFKDEDCC